MKVIEIAFIILAVMVLSYGYAKWRLNYVARWRMHAGKGDRAIFYGTFTNKLERYTVTIVERQEEDMCKVEFSEFTRSTSEMFKYTPPTYIHIKLLSPTGFY